MNVTQLESICKTKSRSVLESAKHSLKNNPFVETKINKGIIDDVINFEIMQSLGVKIRKEFLKSNNLENEILLKIVQDRINFYQFYVIREFNRFASQIINS